MRFKLRHLKRSLFVLVWVLTVASIPVYASVEVDRRYKIESMGFLKSWDNVDGLFTQYVQSAFDHFSKHQSRFVISDLSKVDSLIAKNSLEYKKMINDLEILRAIAKNTQTETLIRTKITHSKNKYQILFEWLHAPKMEILSSLTFELEEPKKGEGFEAEHLAEIFEQNLQELILKVPFLGNLTGRDGKSVTLNIGSRASLKEGDILWVATLDQVKIHPLLHAVVDWKIEETGKIRVDSVEEDLAFCTIIEEVSQRDILPLQKVIHIERPDVRTAIKHATEKTLKKIDFRETLPSLGWFSASLPLGGYSRDFSLSSNAASYSGGGFAYGGQADGEVWLTREWFASLSTGYSAWHFTEKNMLSGNQSISTQNGGVGGGLFNFQISLGYTQLFRDQFDGPKAWIKAGYKTSTYTLPSSPVDYTMPISFSSVFFGIGGTFPLKNKVWEMTGFLNFRLLPVIQGNYTDGQKLHADTSSDVQFHLGVIYHLNMTLALRAGCEMLATSASFSNGTHLTQKLVTFSPALVYYF